MNTGDWACHKEDELRDVGHIRLSDLIDLILDDTLDNDHESMDLYVDEAVQLSRDLNEPWVEIFIRHWRL